MANRKWIRQRLGVGDVSRVTQAVSVVNANEDFALENLENWIARIS